MSLRPDDRSSRSGRSHERSRSRSRDGRTEKESDKHSKKKSSSSKSEHSKKSSSHKSHSHDSKHKSDKKKTRFVESESESESGSSEESSSRSESSSERTESENEYERRAGYKERPKTKEEEARDSFANIGQQSSRSTRQSGISSYSQRRNENEFDPPNGKHGEAAYPGQRRTNTGSVDMPFAPFVEDQETPFSPVSRGIHAGLPYPGQANAAQYHDDRASSVFMPSWEDHVFLPPSQPGMPPRPVPRRSVTETQRLANEQHPEHEMPAMPHRAFSLPGEQHGNALLDSTTTRTSHLSISGAPPSGGFLSVGGNQAASLRGGAPPASPLLEAYKGTYQSISPMPSPLILPNIDDDDDVSLSPLEPESEEERKKDKKKTDSKGKKRVVMYDADADAAKLMKALNHKEAKSEPLIEILPDLSHDQLLQLRKAYKNTVKIGGRGVNLSKQLKATTTGNFGKAVYVTSLGRWESEAYWANFWYQSHSSSRELLIEALMGRSNADIREIKDSFSDKRYDDDLRRCMEKELKPDKFRTAVLLALDGKRQEETDVWPPEYRKRDVQVLYKALTAKEGGESAILEIVLRRSDSHLRDVLKLFEKEYNINFAREALKKSQNLVGEVIAHVLNGVINRPARDCLLLKHAIDDLQAKKSDVELRYELLMSRIIRWHWDKTHLAKIKLEYKKKYSSHAKQDLEAASKGDFGKFCKRLMET